MLVAVCGAKGATWGPTAPSKVSTNRGLSPSVKRWPRGRPRSWLKRSYQTDLVVIEGGEVVAEVVVREQAAREAEAEGRLVRGAAPQLLVGIDRVDGGDVVPELEGVPDVHVHQGAVEVALAPTAGEGLVELAVQGIEARPRVVAHHHRRRGQGGAQSVGDHPLRVGQPGLDARAADAALVEIGEPVVVVVEAAIEQRVPPEVAAAAHLVEKDAMDHARLDERTEALGEEVDKVVAELLAAHHRADGSDVDVLGVRPEGDHLAGLGVGQPLGRHPGDEVVAQRAGRVVHAQGVRDQHRVNVSQDAQVGIGLSHEGQAHRLPVDELVGQHDQIPVGQEDLLAGNIRAQVVVHEARRLGVQEAGPGPTRRASQEAASEEEKGYAAAGAGRVHTGEDSTAVKHLQTGKAPTFRIAAMADPRRKRRALAGSARGAHLFEQGQLAAFLPTRRP